MKKLHLLVILIVCLFCTIPVAYSQGLSVLPPVVFPANPMIGDSIYIATTVKNGTITVKIFKDLRMSNDTIDIEVCVSQGHLTVPSTHRDTFAIGTQTAGFHTVVCRGYETVDSLCENKLDSAKSTLTFRVGIANAVPQTIIGENHLTLHPNPASQTQYLQLKTTKPEQVSIQLTDLSGRLLKEVFDGILPVGQQKLPIAISDLAPGMYFYRVRIDGREQVLRMVKQ